MVSKKKKILKKNIIFEGKLIRETISVDQNTKLLKIFLKKKFSNQEAIE